MGQEFLEAEEIRVKHIDRAVVKKVTITYPAAKIGSSEET